MDLFCPWDGAKYLIFSSNTPALLFYSHIPAMLLALAVGLTSIIKARHKTLAWLMAILCGLFFAWAFFDLILWATNSPSTVMFFWSLQILLEPLIFIFAFYITYVFIKQKDLNIQVKLIFFLSFLPILLFLGTHYNLIGVTLVDCLAIEGFFAKFVTYIIEFSSILLIILFSIYAYKKETTASRKQEIAIFSQGITLFLVAFSWGNIMGSFSDNWKLAQAGLIGMPLFVAVLGYAVVSFKTFNLKILSSQALLFTTGFLIFSIFFISSIDHIRIILALTLLLFCILGVFLVRSIKREVRQREQLETLTKQLSQANEKLTVLDKARAEFISIASHQLRTPPATVKWYLSALLSGDYGPVPADLKAVILKAERSNNLLISLIEDILNVSRIERGTLEFLFEEVDFYNLAKITFEQLEPLAQDKKLNFEFVCKTLPLPKIHADKEKLRQVMNNLIDNAIKYTPNGQVQVIVSMNQTEVRFEVKDSGKGINPDELSKIFEKYTRGKESFRQAAGLGLGLYVAKIVIKEHQGKIWAESPGEGKGSGFIFTLPINAHLNATSQVDFNALNNKKSS